VYWKLIIGVDVEVADEYLRYRVGEELGPRDELLQLDHVSTLLFAIERQMCDKEIHFAEWRIDERSQTSSLSERQSHKTNDLKKKIDSLLR
jgi:hypothetical protein